MVDERTALSKMAAIRFTNNLHYLMQRNKVKSIDLAEYIEMSAELIGKLRNGVLSNPSLKVLARISTYFGITVDDLIFADLEMIADEISNRGVTWVPIVGWDQVKQHTEIMAKEHVLIGKTLPDSVFALYLEHDYGIFAARSHVLINTALDLSSNDYVLVVNNDSSVCSIKRLIIEDDYYLSSVLLEISSTVKYNKSEHLIYGVVIGCQKTEYLKI